MFNYKLPQNFSFEFMNKNINITLVCGAYGFVRQILYIINKKLQDKNTIKNTINNEHGNGLFSKNGALGIVGPVLYCFIDCQFMSILTAFIGGSVLTLVVPQELNCFIVFAFGIDIGIRLYEIATCYFNSSDDVPKPNVGTHAK